MCLAAALMIFVAVAGFDPVQRPAGAPGGQVCLNGGMVCNGACIPDPKTEDHVMVLFAIDGTPEIRTEVERMK